MVELTTVDGWMFVNINCWRKSTSHQRIRWTHLSCHNAAHTNLHGRVYDRFKPCRGDEYVIMGEYEQIVSSCGDTEVVCPTQPNRLRPQVPHFTTTIVF